LWYDSHWEDLLARWNIKYMLLRKAPDDEEVLKVISSARTSGRWKQLYEDDISVLFEKVPPLQSK